MLVVGGSGDEETRSRLRSTELFDAGRRGFTPGPALRIGRYKLPNAVVALSARRVVVAGDGPFAELLDLRARTSRPLGPRGLAAFAFATATRLDARRVLVTGGYDEAIQPTDRAEVIAVPVA